MNVNSGFIKIRKELAFEMKLGLFGGTFDPVHNGHIRCAEEIKAAFSLDAIIFIPAGNPTHKIASRVTPGAMRIEMLRRAVCGKDGFYVWETEVKRRGYTYTVDTLEELSGILAGDFGGERAELYYIVGTDVIGSVDKWKDFGKVSEMCGFIAVKRPGEDDDDVYEKNVEKARNAGAVVFCADIKGLIKSSSSEIRQAVYEKRDISTAVPEGVAKYIIDNKLYRYDRPVSEELIRADLKERLTEEKYIHSLGVAAESERLAGIYGADKDKCRLAGLLHDCAKCLTKVQLDWMGVTPDHFNGGDPYCGRNDRVLHGYTGRILAEKRYGVTDEEVLSAVENHVTGSPGMDLVSQIVFLSDYTEKNRRGAHYERIREELQTNGIYAAILLSCDMTAELVIKRGEALDINTIRTRNWAIAKLGDGALPE